MAGIRKKESKTGGKPTWQVYWRDPDGKQKAKNFPTQREARAYASQVENDKNRGNYRDPNAGKVTFKAYAEEWLKVQTFNPSTRETTTGRLNLHVYPHIGGVPLAALTPTKVQGMVKALQQTSAVRKPKPGEKPQTLSAAYVGTILTDVKTILNAAVADDKIAKNPAQASSVRPPKATRKKVVPFTHAQVAGIRDNLPEPYRIVATVAAGCGLRQGEVFGLSPDDIDHEAGVIHVRRQVKILGSRLVFDLPKGGKERDVPLPKAVGLAIKKHTLKHRAHPVALPWGDVDGPAVTVTLLVTSRERKAMNRNYFNPRILKPALIAAKVEPVRENMTHALRHWYASVLLDAGESIVTVANNLGHADPAFTLRTYTHLMHDSNEKTREAVDNALADVATASRDDSLLTPTAEG